MSTQNGLLKTKISKQDAFGEALKRTLEPFNEGLRNDLSKVLENISKPQKKGRSRVKYTNRDITRHNEKFLQIQKKIRELMKSAKQLSDPREEKINAILSDIISLCKDNKSAIAKMKIARGSVNSSLQNIVRIEILSGSFTDHGKNEANASHLAFDLIMPKLEAHSKTSLNSSQRKFLQKAVLEILKKNR